MMRPTFKVSSIWNSLLISAVVLSLSLGAIATHAQTSLHSFATRHVPEQVSSHLATLIGPAPSQQTMHLNMLLPLRNRKALTALLDQLYDPSSPEYHHFLKPSQFTEEFGPSVRDYQTVVNWAHTNGFTVGPLAKNRLLVPITGTVAQVNTAFHLTMRVYRRPKQNGRFYAPDREPSIDMSVPLWHLSGLSNYSVPRPAATRAPNGEMANASGSGPSGAYLPEDMRAAYYGGSTLTGAGQCVGLAEFDGYNLNDLTDTFDGAATATTNGNTYTLSYSPSGGGGPYSVEINNVLLDGGSLTPSSGDPDSEAEVVLDIAQVAGMAPGLSQIRVYIVPDAWTTASPNYDFPSNSGDSEIFNQMVEDGCKQLSISWNWRPESLTANDPIFENMAADGQSFLAASGDSGSWPNSAFYYPEEDAHVTAVGGTDLTTNGAHGAWDSETGWADSGGGVSPDDIAIPSYQQSSGFTCSGCSSSYRNAPDVAMEANYDNYVCSFGSCEADWGGTSFAAPRWAAFLALVNQEASANGNNPVGFINQAIYSIGLSSTYSSDFHDITSGSNGNYSASTGFDLVTGWGSPNSSNLINALAGPFGPKNWQTQINRPNYEACYTGFELFLTQENNTSSDQWYFALFDSYASYSPSFSWTLSDSEGTIATGTWSYTGTGTYPPFSVSRAPVGTPTLTISNGYYTTPECGWEPLNGSYTAYLQ